MLEDVSEIGVSGFYTYHLIEGKNFRPCATRIRKSDAVQATEIEAKEIEYIYNKNFPNVFFGGMSLGNFILPIHLHPFIWQTRTLQDVKWYNRKNVEYIPFYNYKNGRLKYIPKELSVFYEKREGEGLTFSPQEGYSYDKSLEQAKIKAAMELIEKDVITLWWHREMPSRTIIIDDDIADSDILYIKEQLSNQNIGLTLLEIENDLGVYVIVCVLNQNDYPSITYGSSAHFNIKEAVKYAIFEAISCIVGLRYEFIHFKQIYKHFVFPIFTATNSLVKLSSYKEILSLERAITQYDIYYSFVKSEEGYLVKAYCYELQQTLYTETVPLTKRFFTANTSDVVIKKHFPFL